MLEGKIAVVTGGSRGIGKAITEAFQRAGATVLVCSRNKDSAANAYSCDVANYEEVVETVRRIQSDFGQIDILVNAAGISPKAEKGMKIRCYQQTVEQWSLVMNVNLNGAFYFSKEVMNGMMEKGWGRIINISSIVGLTNSEHGPACAAYVTSKTGMIGLTRAMAYDLAPYGITVNAVAPGRIQTEMSAMNNPYYNELHEKLIPMHRFGTVEDVAEICLFLASEKASYITGETVNITGGWYI